MADGNKNPTILKLGAKKALITHNYSLFLERQARLYTLSVSRGWCESFEVEEKQGALLLDDLTIFAISGRRLIDLCQLQSACNKSKIDELTIDKSYSPIKTASIDGKKIGFYTLLNRIIHMSYFKYFSSRARLEYEFFNSGDQSQFMEIIQKGKNTEDHMDGIVFLKEERNPPSMLRLKDIIDASMSAAEKIIDTCSNESIYLESIFNA